MLCLCMNRLFISSEHISERERERGGILNSALIKSLQFYKSTRVHKSTF